MALSAAARRARARIAGARSRGDHDAAALARADFARIKRAEVVDELLTADPIDTREATALAASILTRAGVAW